MKELLIICILLILMAALGVYLITWATWRNIDIISSGTADYIRTGYDSDFDADLFRTQVRSILRELDFLGDNRVIFHTPFYERRKSRRTLNAHTGFPGQRFILLTPGWAVRLYQEFNRPMEYAESGDPEITRSVGCVGSGNSDIERSMEDPSSEEDEINCSVGLPGCATMTDLLIYVLAHEMAHKEGQLRPIFVFGKKRLCLGWIREIDADIRAISKSRLPTERVIACIRAEILKKKAGYGYGRPGAGRSAHPAWEYRIACMKEGALGGAMIDEICRDCGVTDRRFCERVKRFYEKRQLHAA